MGRVVVHDDVDIEIGGNVGFYVVEELAEFLAAVTAEAPADHLAGGDVEGREQRGRAVALVIVGSPFRLSGTPATVACGRGLAPDFSRRRSAPAPGGSRYRPSRTFSTNNGSFDGLKVSLR